MRVAAWGATIVVPTWASALGGSISLGTNPLTTGGLALAWGLVGGLLGAAVPWPARVATG